MEFNRLISLVLGFIVIILVFVWINNRIHTGKNTTTGAENITQITPTVTPTPTNSEEKKSWNPFAFLFNKQSPTPTILINSIGPTRTISIAPKIRQPSGTSPQVQVVVKGGNNRVNSVKTATKIPETGLPTLILPLSFITLVGGMYIKKHS